MKIDPDCWKVRTIALASVHRELYRNCSSFPGIFQHDPIIEPTTAKCTKNLQGIVYGHYSYLSLLFYVVMFSIITYLYCALWLVGVCYIVHAADTPEHISVKPSTYRGIIVDAGSGGSRLHVYQWEPRIFNTSPPPLSYPKSNEKWTSRIGPGVANFADNLPALSNHLKPLIDFAKDTLIDEKDKYDEIPIYFYATGGVRLLNTQKRDAVIDAVRDLLRNESFCPFFFHPHFARVISGKWI